MPAVVTEPTKPNERITARISGDAKALIERAAMLTGATNLNSFLSNAVIKEAKRVIAEHEMLLLSRTDSQAFVDALDEPVVLNDNLIKAAKRYKEAMQDADSQTG